MRFIKINSQFINLKYVFQIVERKNTFWIYYFSKNSTHILGSGTCEEKFEVTKLEDYIRVKNWLDENTI